MMARQVRPWLAKPARFEAPRVRAIDWGPNQRIPFHQAQRLCRIKVRMYGCNLYLYAIAY
jgi:hypothetical protein